MTERWVNSVVRVSPPPWGRKRLVWSILFLVIIMLQQCSLLIHGFILRHNYSGRRRIHDHHSHLAFRGGDSLSPPAPQQPGSSSNGNNANNDNANQPPKTILLKHVALALRLTSEWNRRMQQGAAMSGVGSAVASDTDMGTTVASPSHPSLSVQVQGSDWTTPFHARRPRSNPTRGVGYWGPDLLPYLEYVVGLLDIADGVEIPLAMVYLDRACSVETPRPVGILACPFCTPRTVHRLILVSLLLATEATRGGSENDGLRRLEIVSTTLGIPAEELRQMVEWMRDALGVEGMAVSMEEWNLWNQKWEAQWFPESVLVQSVQKLASDAQQQSLQQHAPGP